MLTWILAAAARAAPAPERSGDMAERAAIEATVQDYFDGVSKPDLASLQRAFLPEARLLSVKDGAFVQVAIPEWHARVVANAASAPKANWRRIVSIDVFGSAASVRADADYATFQFIDYLSLLKVEGRWRIVTKIFHRHEK
jgi:protease I